MLLRLIFNMNLIQKTAQIPKQIMQMIREDVPSRYYGMNSIQYYEEMFPKRYDNTISYIVTYRGVDTTTSWGPFNTIESANDWTDKLFNAYSIDCDILYIHNPKSDPNTWII